MNLSVTEINPENFGFLLYCFDPYKVHQKKISKGLHIPESAIAVALKMKPGQKLCMNCMKSYQEKLNFAASGDDDKNDGHTEEDPDYIDQEINRTTLSDSATLLGLSPTKAVGKQDRAGYGKQKVKKIKKSLLGLWHLLVTLMRMNYYIMIHQNVPNVLTQID